jgi:hypothetical protein
VKLDADEFETLAARAAAIGATKSQIIRDALRVGPGYAVTPAALTRAEALQILGQLAQGGSAAAAEAVARELRLQPVSESDRLPIKTGPVSLEEARAELRAVP